MRPVQTRPAAVCVTGIGAWTPFGIGWRAVWDALCEGRSCFAPVGEGFGPDPSILAGRIPEWDAFRAEFPQLRPPLPIPITRLALVAAKHALLDAKLEDEAERARFGVMLNRNRGPAQVVTKLMEPVFRDGPRKTSPLLFSQSVSNAPLGAVATHFAMRGPHLLTLGGGALLTAFDAIQRGDAPGILVGGFEEHVPHLFKADLDNGIIAPIVDQPRLGEGPVMSEGAVCIMLESESSARQRGIEPLARLLAVERGLSRGPGEDPVRLWGQPSPQQFAALGQRALAVAGASADELVVHAGSRSGVAAFEAAEQHLQEALGLESLAARGRIGSIKHLLGESMGMGTFANLAWVSTMLARRELPVATCRDGVGVETLDPPRSLTLMTHLDAHGSGLACVLERS